MQSEPSKELALSTHDLTKILGGKVAVDHLNLSVPYGEILGLLGPNGAGKTTTLRMIAGHLVPTEGKVMVCGNSLEEKLTEAKSKIGFLSAGMKLYPNLTGRENLTYFGKLRGMEKLALEARLEFLVKDFRLTDFFDQKFGTLSSGQQQRLVIANTVLHDPKVLILDEITASLDILSSSFIVEFVRNERARGKGIVFSTHIMSEAEYLCDEIVLMHEGKILDRGKAKTLIERKQSSNLTMAFFAAIESAGKE